ncbi:MAG: glycosyltransferase, partial [Chromatiales bacterium]|nr:glycosyltransferase [Chromatiales bacterium]
MLVVIGGLEVGGAERHLATVLPRLARRGIECEVYVLGRRGALAPTLEAGGVAVGGPPLGEMVGRWPRTMRRPLLLVLAVAGLLARLRRRPPSVVHFFLPEAYLLGGLACLLAPRPRRVMSRRSLNHYQQRHPVLARLERWLHRRMDAVLANSEAVRADLLGEGVPAARLHLVRNGVPTDDPPCSRAEARARLGLDAAAWILVCVANLIPYKGHADLLDA